MTSLFRFCLFIANKISGFCFLFLMFVPILLSLFQPIRIPCIAHNNGYSIPKKRNVIVFDIWIDPQ